ncbi:MAG: hypothetical protein KDB03_18495 [Planctomycetales bacterium]|nr:hypothetical protein [Planctomycetales bacterium]
MNTQSNNQGKIAKQVTGELVDGRQQAVSSRALDNLSQSLDHSGLISRFLAPKEQRQITLQVQERVRDATVDQAISQVQSEANKRCAEIELAASACRNRLLLEQNKSSAQLKQQEQVVVDREIRHMLLDESANQRRLSETRLLPEDSERLVQLFKHRTALEMLRLAQTHGVDLTTIESSGSQDHSAPDDVEQ